MEKHSFKEILNLLNLTRTAIGFARLETIWKLQIQRFFFNVLWFNEAFYIVNGIVSGAKYFKEDTVHALFLVFVTIAALALIIFKFLLIRSIKLYEVCLENCEKWQKLDHEVVRKNLVTCCGRSIKTIQRMVIYFPVAVLSVLLLGMIIISIVSGKPVPFDSFHVFWRTEQTLFSGSLNCLSQFMIRYDLFLMQCLQIGIVFVIIEYILAMIKSIEQIIKSLESSSTGSQFESSVKVVVELHCELIEQQRTLVKVTSMPILIFQVAAYGIALVDWIVFIFSREQLLSAMGASGIVFNFIIICWINERLRTAYDDLRSNLHNIDWTSLKPFQRKRLLLILMLLDRPILLRAGPFDLISFKGLNLFFNRVYSFGLCINSIVLK